MLNFLAKQFVYMELSKLNFFIYVVAAIFEVFDT